MSNCRCTSDHATTCDGGGLPRGTAGCTCTCHTSTTVPADVDLVFRLRAYGHGAAIVTQGLLEVWSKGARVFGAERGGLLVVPGREVGRG